MSNLYRQKKNCFKFNVKTCISFITLILVCAKSFAQPKITSFTPSSGPVGTVVTITGSNFSTTPSDNIVYFGAVKATVNASTTTTLTVVAPVSSTDKPITVTTGGLTAYSVKPFIRTFTSAATLINAACYRHFVNADLTTGTNPRGIAIADLDGDGMPDIITANSTDGGVGSFSVLRNNGSGTNISFEPHLDFPNGDSTYAIATGDIDGDGLKDIVVSSLVDDNISVFRNLSTAGNISFAQKVDLATGDRPVHILITDIDMDGRPDIVVANYNSNNLSIFRNSSSIGSISMNAPITLISGGTGPIFIAAGDVDGDLKPDIYVANYLSSRILQLENFSTPGIISFDGIGSPSTYGNAYPPVCIAIEDLDFDGKPDLLILSITPSNGGHLVYRRNVSSSGMIGLDISSATYNVYSFPTHLAIGNLNGDFKPDMLVSSINSTGYANSSPGGSSGISFSGNAQQLGFTPVPFMSEFCDLNGDSKPELLSTIPSTGKVSIRKNRLNEPYISGLFPSTAAGGATVMVGGTDLTNVTGVSFGGVPAASFVIVNATKINAVVGTGVSGEVSVSSALYDTANRGGFVFAGPPVINDFTPPHAGFGETVSITGYNLSGATAVSFGGMAAQSFTIVNPYRIDAVVDTGASGLVSVTTPYGTGTRAGFVHLPLPHVLCPGGNTTITSNLTGATYQWQEDTGSGFGDISNNAHFSATNTANLQLTNIPSSWRGYRYRCVINGNGAYSDWYALEFSDSWIGAVSTAWEDPANWSCGTTPDSNTDVVITSGTVIINSNVTVNTLSISPTASITVTTGNNLTVLH